MTDAELRALAEAATPYHDRQQYRSEARDRDEREHDEKPDHKGHRHWWRCVPSQLLVSSEEDVRALLDRLEALELALEGLLEYPDIQGYKDQAREALR